jgi:GR25 family glycosyltransferase involved in LPS biosynthesis
MSLQDVLKDVSKSCNTCITLLKGVSDCENEKKYINNIFKFFIHQNVDQLNSTFIELFKCNLEEELYYEVYNLFSIVYNYITNDGKDAIYEYELSDVEEFGKQLEQNKKWTNLEGKLTVTMTTCKRYDLFRRTMISVLRNVKDLKDYIYEWIVIDDNSSEEMRQQMTKEFPFITYVYKDINNKGHPRSMNMFLDIVKTPYMFNIEDDWEFFFPDNFVSKMMTILNEDTQLGQVLMNINYAEDATTYRFVRGSTMKYTSNHLRYFVHNHYQGQELDEANRKLKFNNCYYWPHFSFRVGITRMSILKELGKYNEQAKHFEMEYAYKYHAKGYKTGFLDSVYCLHIGRRTYERNSDKINAYDLNKEQQFGEQIKQVVDENILSKSLNTSPKIEQNNPSSQNVTVNKKIDIKMFVINLKRRYDRLQTFYEKNQKELVSFDVVEGFHGKYETPTHKTMKLFKSSDYDYRCGLVGAVMSHTKVLKQFLQDHSCEYAIVFEDDITVCPQFNEKVIYLLNKYKFEIMFLHQNPQHGHDKIDFHIKTKIPYAYELDGIEALKQNMGSAAAYIITRKGAENVLQHLNKHGAYNGMDWIMMKTSSLNQRVMYSVPFLVDAPCFQLGQQDTDIQKEYGKLKWTNQEWDKNEFEYLYNELTNSPYYKTGKKRRISVVIKDKTLSYVPFILNPEMFTLSKTIGEINIIHTNNIPWTLIIEEVHVFPLNVITAEDKKNLNRYAVKWYYTNELFYIVPDKFITSTFLNNKVFGDNYLNLACPT